MRKPTYRGYNITSDIDPAGYDISDGGQAQLLRIRIIQTLNEYYDDFEWVGDPSAKINLVFHSNGGLIALYLLQNDSGVPNRPRIRKAREARNGGHNETPTMNDLSDTTAAA